MFACWYYLLHHQLMLLLIILYSHEKNMVMQPLPDVSEGGRRCFFCRRDFQSSYPCMWGKLQFWVNMGDWYPDGSWPGLVEWLELLQNKHDSPATTTDHKMQFWVNIGNWYPGWVTAWSGQMIRVSTKQAWQPHHDHGTQNAVLG